jgi:hypothetical protein
MATGLPDIVSRLASRLAGRSGRGSATGVEIADPWSVRGEPAAPAPVHALLDEIEASAIETYRLHGLPTRLGQYARSRRGKQWKFVAETLTAEERWELFLANDSRKGWRFASLEELGAQDPDGPSDLRKAADLLTACRSLRLSLGGRSTTSSAEDIETALRLGSDWRVIELALSRHRTGGLKLGSPARRGRGD